MTKRYNLTKIECKVLFKKYTQAGLDYDLANDRIELVKNHLTIWKNMSRSRGDEQ